MLILTQACMIPSKRHEGVSENCFLEKLKDMHCTERCTNITATVTVAACSGMLLWYVFSQHGKLCCVFDPFPALLP